MANEQLILSSLFQQMLHSNTKTHLCISLISGFLSCPSRTAVCLRTVFQNLLWHFWCLTRGARVFWDKVRKLSLNPPMSRQDMSFCFALEQHRTGSANHGLWLLHPAVGSDPLCMLAWYWDFVGWKNLSSHIPSWHLGQQHFTSQGGQQFTKEGQGKCSISFQCKGGSKKNETTVTFTKICQIKSYWYLKFSLFTSHYL